MTGPAKERNGRTPAAPTPPPPAAPPRWCLPAAVLAVLVGWLILADSARRTSATYDEVTYLKVAARWWRTGEQSQITRMGSPLSFWKLQQAPVLWWLDHSGRRGLIDDPETRQAELLPWLRVGASWVWVVALGVTAGWARRLYGPRAMATAAWLFALGPNLLAHGSLITMELPLVAAGTAAVACFWLFLAEGRRWAFWASAAATGLAFSCKFTAVLWPPLLGLAWWVRVVVQGRRPPVRSTWHVAAGMAGFLAVMAGADVAVTAGARLPLSSTVGEGHPSLDGRFGPRIGRVVTAAVETPIPQDWVGFATQMMHQKSGGPSYLLGVRRTRGWWYYYLVALAVKVPLAVLAAVGVRAWLAWNDDGPALRRDLLIPLLILGFLGITAVGSTRNYGVRYVLPLAPLAVVWVSALAERAGRAKGILLLALMGQAIAVADNHPNELVYFNGLAGGPLGGRHVLADSNLDWGQGLRSLAALQRRRPEFRDLTLYYFGDTRPAYYGVVGTCHVVDAGTLQPKLPPDLSAATKYLAVSASLQWGPWGPEGYFRALDGVQPVAWTDDSTVAIYLTSDVAGLGAGQ